MPTLPVPEIADAQLVFGQAQKVLPAWDEIPERFKKFNDPFARVASTLFFDGGKLSDFGLTPKEGVDVGKAMRAIKVCLSSFAPKHEHKEAGVAYLLSEWFDRTEKKSDAA